MFNIGFQELVIILVLVLILFGPGKLPQIGSAIGKGLAEFKKAARALEEDPEPKSRPIGRGPDDEPEPPMLPGGGSGKDDVDKPPPAA